MQAIQFAASDAAKQRGAFDQFIAAQRENPAFGQTAAFVFRATDALQKRGDGTRRAELANQIHRADVDAEFQRGGGDERFQFAALQAGLRRRGAVWPKDCRDAT